MSQTGGGCRASNYIGFIRRALENAPVCRRFRLSLLNANGMETNPGFTITLPLITKAMQAVVYGDIFMRVLYATRPYEANAGIPPMPCMRNGKQICIKALSKRQLCYDGSLAETSAALSMILTNCRDVLMLRNRRLALSARSWLNSPRWPTTTW